MEDIKAPPIKEQKGGSWEIGLSVTFKQKVNKILD